MLISSKHNRNVCFFVGWFFCVYDKILFLVSCKCNIFCICKILIKLQPGERLQTRRPCQFFQNWTKVISQPLTRKTAIYILLYVLFYLWNGDVFLNNNKLAQSWTALFRAFIWGAVWKNIIYCCDSVFVAYLCNFLSNLYIGFISFIISDKMFYKHDKKRLQNKFDISNLLYLIYQLYYIGQNASQRWQKMTKK